MMATFMAVMVPRAAVCAERIAGGARHAVVGDRPGGAGDGPAAPGQRRAPRRVVPLSGCRRAGAAGHHVRVAGRARRPRSSAAPARARRRCVNLVPRLFDATGGSVLVDGVDVRDRRPLRAARTDRPRAAEAVSVLRHRCLEPALRQARRHRGRDVGGAGGGPGARLRRRRCPVASRPGSCRAARTCRAGSGSGWRSPGRWCASPRSTCSTTRSRRSTSPPTPACGQRSPRTRSTPRC